MHKTLTIKHSVLAAIFCIGLSACGSSGGEDPGPGNGNEAPTGKTHKISFIHLNDLHAHLTEHYDYHNIDDTPYVVKRGGLARIATAIKQIRSDNPHSVLMNIGDTFHGGVEALYTQGNAIVAPMNQLGVDIGVPGNWDFAYGPGVTRQRFTSVVYPMAPVPIEKVTYPNLAANVESTTPEPFLPATYSMTVDGVKIGFIGITSDIVPRMSPGLAATFSFLEGKQAYVDLVNRQAHQLREQEHDIVVVMSELGVHKDIALADSIDATTVDVFFSAHTHELVREPYTGHSGALVVEAGNDTYLGRMDIYVKDGTVTDRQWQIIDIDHHFAEDDTIRLLVDQARAPFLDEHVDLTLPLVPVSQHLTQPINTVIGNTAQALDRRQALDNSFNKAFTEALRNYTGADVAITPGFRFDSVIPVADQLYEDTAVANGDITIEDVYRMFPVPFYVAVGDTNGANLKSIIESNLTAVFSTEVFNHSGGWFDGYDGLSLTLNLKNPDGERIVDIRRKDDSTPIADDDILHVAGCVRPVEFDANDTLCSYSGFSNVTSLTNPDTAEPWTVIDFLTKMIGDHALPDSRTHDITDESDTLLWPQSDYYQPLHGAQ